MSAHDGADLPLSDLVTLIITTSPTPSAPSTDLISEILDSFRLYCPALLTCRVIVVFDTYDRIAPSNRLKKGQITPAGARAVEAYKRNVKALVLREWYPETTAVEGDTSHVFVVEHSEAEYGSPKMPENHVPLTTSRTADARVAFVEPAARLGFGLAVRSALRAASTPYVWVQQHDWPLARAVPLAALVGVMRASEAGRCADGSGKGEGKGGDGEVMPPVKYVCLPAVRMLSYATSAHVVPFPALRALTAELKRDFIALLPTPSLSQPGKEEKEEKQARVPLTPLFFWHDKPHLAATAHYLARVFPSRLAIARGDFIEDSIGQRARAQMKEGNWAKWACWLYYPGEGREVCLQHRHGRRWRGVEADAETRALFADVRGKRGLRRDELVCTPPN
ncbi:hypothetical protein GGS24DRAFT_432382 [Hypoxylon argillaceum]|nr:hypothetical protein GGS24DRAFT_432382 [Hypoxylon argillaceum]